VLFLTGHHSAEKNLNSWPEQIPNDVTLVIYMPGYEYAGTARRLLAAGLRLATPCAVISQATSSDQQVYRTTISELSGVPRLPAPTLLVVGEVVRLTAEDSRFADAASVPEHDQLFPNAAPEVMLQLAGYSQSQGRPE
jgi:siroheme synthase